MTHTIVNRNLDRMLTHTADLRRVSETTTRGVTVLAGASTSTGIRCHIQPVSPDQVQTRWGLEKVGDFEVWFNSTETLAVGVTERQLLTGRTGPWTGVKYWIRAVRPVTDIGLEHIEALLERTNST